MEKSGNFQTNKSNISQSDTSKSSGNQKSRPEKKSETDRRVSVKQDSSQKAADYMKKTDLERYFEMFYRRYGGNENIREAEALLKNLLNAQWAVLSPSGSSAIDFGFSVCQKQSKGKKSVVSPWITLNDIYGGTIDYINKVLIKRRGIKVIKFLQSSDETYQTERLIKKIKSLRPQVLFIESISNPLLIVPEIAKIIKVAKKYKVTVIVDDTFAPLLWNPLELGADLVIHSATKYLGGHGDLFAGVICGNNPQLFRQVLEYQRQVGSIIGPDEAKLLVDYLPSFISRFKKHCENAWRLAHFLNDHPKIAQVRYPGLNNHATAKEAEDLFSAKSNELFDGQRCYGAMITFEIKGDSQDQGGKDETRRKSRQKAVETFIETIGNDPEHPVEFRPTLGDKDSILLPAAVIFSSKNLPDGTIRFSVGCDDYQSLENSVKKALEKIEY